MEEARRIILDGSLDQIDPIGKNIRLIKIYIGDQMANAVGRCKIAKRKIEELTLEEAIV